MFKMLPLSQWKVRGRERKLLFNNEDKDMKAGKETEMYNQGYMDGYEDGENAHIEPILPKIKGVANDDPDYWTRLEHTYAGMAMQGILANYGVEPLPYDAANDAREYAHALVKMMREKEERK